MRRIALVAVESTLHGNHRFPAEPPQQQSTGMGFYGREREPRDVLVGDCLIQFDEVREAAETGPQDESNFRHHCRARTDGLDRLVDGGGEFAGGHACRLSGISVCGVVVAERWLSRPSTSPICRSSMALKLVT